jgi:hypothetical protein
VAFRRYANAVVAHPLASQAGWERVRRAGGSRVASASSDLVAQATEILGARLDPDRYLLSHATIVCSVDTDPTPNVRLGKVEENGRTVNRRWGNYLITPNHSKYINNNGDAWTRPVLLKSYRTFIGSHNFLEHVQVEDLSKGRIIDAVPRDVGESLYIDILVATDQRHNELVADIQSGRLSAMSMGCFLPGTQVSLADGRRIAIEDVVPGEMVLTHKGRAREVLNKQVRHGQWSMRRINAVGAQAEIVATDNHPFFVVRDGVELEVRADALTLGDALLRPGHEPARVSYIETEPYTGWVYDMEVEEDHSYVVEGVAVHNCNVEHTTCTKCGNVAVDETEMCEHIRYQKLNKYFDNTGKQRVIAELCGHESEDPTGGVTFIEASWVANPAFTGAVMRNILSAKEVSPDMVRQAHAVLATPPRKWVASPSARAANVRVAEDNPVFDFSSFEDKGDAEASPELTKGPSETDPELTKDPSETDPEAAPASKPATPAKPEAKNTDLDDTVERLYKQVLDRVERRVDDTLKGKPSPIPEKSTMAPNENLNKEASVGRTAAQRLYVAAVRDILHTAKTSIDVVDRIAAFEQSSGISAPVHVYRTAVRVGATHRYSSESSYLSACADALGRVPNQPEADALVRIGRILNHHAEAKGPRSENPARSQR